jgi:hypothetical protein
MIQRTHRFTDNSFIMAYHMLIEREKRWVVRDFERYRISKRLAADFYNYLIEKDILLRVNALGPGSSCIVRDRERLFGLCRENFSGPEKRVVSFVCPRGGTAFLADLKETGLEFILARFSGVSPGLRYVQDESLYVYLPDPGLFKYDRLYALEKKFGIYRVTHGGNAFFLLPRYRKFLRHGVQRDEGVSLPADFYTYLDMAGMENPRGKEQALYMEKKLKGKEGSFL